MAARQPDEDDVIAGINVTPLVDIALVLLVIFMVTAKVLVSPAVAMTLPQSGASTEVRSPFTLEMAADGAVVVNGARVVADRDIVGMAEAARSKNPEAYAIIRADRAVPHGRVIRAIDLVKQGGIARVAFSVAPGADGDPLVGP